MLHSWETGRSYPNAGAFFRLASVGNADLLARINRFMNTHGREFKAGELSSPDGIAKLMRELAADEPIAALARNLHTHRTTVTRWLTGRTDPRLPEFLKFVQHTTHRILQFVEMFANPLQLKSTRVAFRSHAAQQRIAFELPMSHAVLRALELKSYHNVASDKHLEFISRMTGLQIKEAESLLIALNHAGLIRPNNGRWCPVDIMTVDTRNTIDRDIELKRFWIDLAKSRLDDRRLMQTSLFSYNLFAISHHGYDQIRALHLEYYERVRRIVGNDTNPQRVALTSMQLIALDE